MLKAAVQCSDRGQEPLGEPGRTQIPAGAQPCLCWGCAAHCKRVPGGISSALQPEKLLCSRTEGTSSILQEPGWQSSWEILLQTFHMDGEGGRGKIIRGWLKISDVAQVNKKHDRRQHVCSSALCRILRVSVKHSNTMYFSFTFK